MMIIKLNKHFTWNNLGQQRKLRSKPKEEKLKKTGENRLLRAIPKVPDIWHLKDRKLIFYTKGKDELMKKEVMKKRDKGFMYLI